MPAIFGAAAYGTESFGNDAVITNSVDGILLAGNDNRFGLNASLTSYDSLTANLVEVPAVCLDAIGTLLIGSSVEQQQIAFVGSTDSLLASFGEFARIGLSGIDDLCFVTLGQQIRLSIIDVDSLAISSELFSVYDWHSPVMVLAPGWSKPPQTCAIWLSSDAAEQLAVNYPLYIGFAEEAELPLYLFGANCPSDEWYIEFSDNPSDDTILAISYDPSATNVIGVIGPWFDTYPPYKGVTQWQKK